MTNSSTQTKSEDLQAISDELDLNLKINLVPLDGSETLYLPKSTNKESTRTKIQVTFPDGRKICSSKVLEALIEVVKYAGAERVRELRINCCADNLILKLLHLVMKSHSSLLVMVGYVIPAPTLLPNSTK